jgi:hypothetical protein
MMSRRLELRRVCMHRAAYKHLLDGLLKRLAAVAAEVSRVCVLTVKSSGGHLLPCPVVATMTRKQTLRRVRNGTNSWLRQDGTTHHRGPLSGHHGRQQDVVVCSVGQLVRRGSQLPVLPWISGALRRGQCAGPQSRGDLERSRQLGATRPLAAFRDSGQNRPKADASEARS